MVSIGEITIPKELEETIDEIRKSTEKDETKARKGGIFSSETSLERKQKNYLTEFERLFDPVIVSMFYGLYKSQKLPPEGSKISLDLEGKVEFGDVNISKYRGLFNNLLFSLWVKNNGMPEPGRTSDYREELYNFIEEILNFDYFKNILIPFYTKKAAATETERSFISRLEDSNRAKYKKEELGFATPEYIFEEFHTKQKEFVEKVINPISEELEEV